MNRTWRLVALVVAAILVFPTAASAAIRIHKIRYDPPGADYTSNRQLRDSRRLDGVPPSSRTL
jgi:hypothetical protein